MIERFPGEYTGRNKASAYKDLVWTVATAVDTGADIVGQTQSALALIEANLIEAGSDKTRILSAQVYISDMRDKPVVDEVWCEWVGGDLSNWPQRACVGVQLEGDVLIEVSVTAARNAKSII